MSKIYQGGGVYFIGGCIFSPILGGVYMKLNQFGGGLFEFHSDLGGGLLFSWKKCQNWGSVHIFHQIRPNYWVNLLKFCFFKRYKSYINQSSSRTLPGGLKIPFLSHCSKKMLWLRKSPHIWSIPIHSTIIPFYPN